MTTYFRCMGETLLHALSEYECHSLVLPHGEPTKSFDSLPKIYEAMLQAKISQASNSVIALGGGVIGDLAVFAASSFLRGYKLVQDPRPRFSLRWIPRWAEKLAGESSPGQKSGRRILPSAPCPDRPGSIEYASEALYQ